MNIDDLLKSSKEQDNKQHGFTPILLERLGNVAKLEQKEYLMCEKLDDFFELFSTSPSLSGTYFGHLKNENAEIKDLYNIPLYELVVALSCLPKTQNGIDKIVKIAKESVNENVYVDVDFI